MSFFRVAPAFAGLLGLASCASIVNGTNQSLSVMTVSNGAPIVNANCELDSGRGTWFVNTPGSVVVHRGYSALMVKCSKSGYQDASEKVKSSTSAMELGNAAFGLSSVIGVGVDVTTGAAYTYPNLITVSLLPTPPAVPAPPPSPAPAAAAAPAPAAPAKS